MAAAITRGGWLTLALIGALTPVLWAAQPRDPFQPPVLSCPDVAASPERWRLAGIIGQPERRLGWVITPERRWLRLQLRQTVLHGRWQVTHIDTRTLKLQAVPGDALCPPVPGDVTLTLGNK
ncbi:Protein of unknown function (DUF2531) [Serratia sp. FGI94]|uniref:HofP DNA utilization family protein n=1 Tax=Serratia sp. FGI94 TaxID=671990 RepID=UPI0002A710CE|nr:HofP DNA utilization family protein [Serratia sp. FGI94]AGB84503.1 Protein of unknown function (DUF2531) [Serratia sp. FGI94]